MHVAFDDGRFLLNIKHDICFFGRKYTCNIPCISHAQYRLCLRKDDEVSQSSLRWHVFGPNNLLNSNNVIVCPTNRQQCLSRRCSLLIKCRSTAKGGSLFIGIFLRIWSREGPAATTFPRRGSYMLDFKSQRHPIQSRCYFKSEEILKVTVSACGAKWTTGQRQTFISFSSCQLPSSGALYPDVSAASA